MITEIHSPWQPRANTQDWQSELRHAISNPVELLELLELPTQYIANILTVKQKFNLRVPRGYVARMRKGDFNDPLLRQVLPLKEERKASTGFGLDPVGDLMSEKSPGFLHKYHGRALIVTTGACAIHCRYCFRQHFDYGKTKQRYHDHIVEQIAADPSISEIILSGGDPLSLSDQRLTTLTQALARIPHIKRLRLHTRLPIVLPERVNDDLLAWLSSTGLQTVIVVHANHANEIDQTVGDALQQLVHEGFTVLNQAVLLKGVNDNIDALVALQERLFMYQVLPYYLHMLDKVKGAAHFDVPLATAQALMEQLRIRLPGYLVPKLVREIAGKPYKQPL